MRSDRRSTGGKLHESVRNCSMVAGKDAHETSAISLPISLLHNFPLSFSLIAMNHQIHELPKSPLHSNLFNPAAQQRSLSRNHDGGYICQRDLRGRRYYQELSHAAFPQQRLRGRRKCTKFIAIERSPRLTFSLVEAWHVAMHYSPCP